MLWRRTRRPGRVADQVTTLGRGRGGQSLRLDHTLTTAVLTVTVMTCRVIRFLPVVTPSDDISLELNGKMLKQQTLCLLGLFRPLQTSSGPADQHWDVQRGLRGSHQRQRAPRETQRCHWGRRGKLHRQGRRRCDSEEILSERQR